MKGGLLALGAVGALALGAAVSKRGSRAEEEDRTSTTLPDYVRRLRAFRSHRPEGYGYASIEDYLFVHGAESVVAPLSPEEVDIVRRAHHRLRFQMQGCYRNAQELVLRDASNTLQYVEGYGLGRACIPLMHGWATVNGKVVDPTWLPVQNKQVVSPPSDWHYFGATFSREEIREIARLQINGRGRKGKLWSVLDFWEAGFPVLRRPRVQAG